MTNMLKTCYWKCNKTKQLQLSNGNLHASTQQKYPLLASAYISKMACFRNMQDSPTFVKGHLKKM